jgi:hypothetical protein
MASKYRVERHRSARDPLVDKWSIERTGDDTLVVGHDPDFLWRVCDLLNAQDEAADSRHVNGTSYLPGLRWPT